MPAIKTIYCPKCKSSAKRHRRRDSKFQYHCKECDFFFTENSKHNRLKGNKEFAEFVKQYIVTSKTKEKVNINELLSNFQSLSKTSIYARKYVFEAFVILRKLFQDYGMLKAWRFSEDEFIISLLNDNKKNLRVVFNANIKSGDILHIYLTIKEPQNLTKIYDMADFDKLVFQQNDDCIIFKLQVANLKGQLSIIAKPFRTHFSIIFPDC